MFNLKQGWSIQGFQTLKRNRTLENNAYPYKLIMAKKRAAAEQPVPVVESSSTPPAAKGGKASGKAQKPVAPEVAAAKPGELPKLPGVNIPNTIPNPKLPTTELPSVDLHTDQDLFREEFFNHKRKPTGELLATTAKDFNTFATHLASPVNRGVAIKLIIATIAMFAVPIGTYFAVKSTNPLYIPYSVLPQSYDRQAWAGYAAGASVWVVMLLYVIMAFCESPASAAAAPPAAKKKRSKGKGKATAADADDAAAASASPAAAPTPAVDAGAVRASRGAAIREAAVAREVGKLSPTAAAAVPPVKGAKPAAGAAAAAASPAAGAEAQAVSPKRAARAEKAAAAAAAAATEAERAEQARAAAAAADGHGAWQLQGKKKNEVLKAPPRKPASKAQPKAATKAKAK